LAVHTVTSTTCHPVGRGGTCPRPIPPDVVAALELLEVGACTAYAIDLWAGSVCLMDAAMRGFAPTADIRVLLQLFHQANGQSYGGFPDVAAFWADGCPASTPLAVQLHCRRTAISTNPSRCRR
jgi:hypothetical protein